MTIAYIGKFQKLWDEEGIARSLESLGVTVIRFDEENFVRPDIDTIIELKPDILLFAKLKINEADRVILMQEAKINKIFAVCFMPDLFFGLYREIKIYGNDPMFSADLVCSPDGGNDKKFKNAGINHRLLRQGIWQDFCYIHHANVPQYDVVFVGSENGEFPYRQELTRFLSHTYRDRFKHIGAHDTNEIRGDALNPLYSSVPIVVGDSVYSSHYWSNRIYETIGRGGFMIHPEIPGLEKEFEYYKDFIPYKYGDFQRLKEKIDYFLHHKEKRDIIRLSGFKKVKENYTLYHRAKELLSIINGQTTSR